MGFGRILDIIFFIYFATHIPITICIDLQAICPTAYFHQSLRELLLWHGRYFKDAMMMDPPVWFKSFVYCEAFLQLPFFPVAAFAFLKGRCAWIKTPAIIYGAHVATTLVPIIAHIMLNDFSKSKHPGPSTMDDRLALLALYLPYLIVPLLIIARMILSADYNPSRTVHSGAATYKKYN